MPTCEFEYLCSNELNLQCSSAYQKSYVKDPKRSLSNRELSAFFGSRSPEVWFLPLPAMPTFHVNHEMRMDPLPYAKLFSIRGSKAKTNKEA